MNFFKRLFSWKKKPSKIEDEKEDEIVDSDDNKIDKKESKKLKEITEPEPEPCLLYTSPSPRDRG